MSCNPKMRMATHIPTAYMFSTTSPLVKRAIATHLLTFKGWEASRTRLKYQPLCFQTECQVLNLEQALRQPAIRLSLSATTTSQVQLQGHLRRLRFPQTTFGQVSDAASSSCLDYLTALSHFILSDVQDSKTIAQLLQEVLLARCDYVCMDVAKAKWELEQPGDKVDCWLPRQLTRQIAAVYIFALVFNVEVVIHTIGNGSAEAFLFSSHSSSSASSVFEAYRLVVVGGKCYAIHGNRLPLAGGPPDARVMEPGKRPGPTLGNKLKRPKLSTA